MKISNFIITHIKGNSLSDYEYFAEVTVKQLFRKPKVRMIHKKYGGFWYFMDTGEFTPSMVVENLERAFNANESMKLAKKYENQNIMIG